ncbi:hypothetical protein CEUSTIGMA_g1286.t1 [Chlamydomonas eustigma]|uniref:peptidyl-tRNA hydrolase n=1 Tax=Chlamydomonas eustigma TaxID=1157962 RepID=A0A250WSW3_9CHLO|nr:hypothetical protein CEUSTIGMA_g1286.t1 [Chlamydomonas eustigma]|eukprot:GAX73836.1 hypothetical protein CEUSTIGMA_g1286.t1 [Chlamydomonas eustigma]
MIDSVLKFASGFIVGFVLKDLSKRLKVKGGSKRRKNAESKGKSSLPQKKATYIAPREEYKMVLCVNEVLKMGKGKIGAQCAHAALGVTQQYRSSLEASFKHWERHGQAKIALKIQDDDEMEELAATAASLDLPTYIVCDAGRTQIPAGSQTVLAIGPGPKSVIDRVTGHLKLL